MYEFLKLGFADLFFSFSQHETGFRSHSQILRIAKVLRKVFVDVMRQLPSKNKYRACPLIDFLHIIDQFRTGFNCDTLVRFGTPLFNIVLEATNTFKST